MFDSPMHCLVEFVPDPRYFNIVVDRPLPGKPFCQVPTGLELELAGVVGLDLARLWYGDGGILRFHTLDASFETQLVAINTILALARYFDASSYRIRKLDYPKESLLHTITKEE